MLNRLRRRTARRLATVEFCDRCGSVCDARCRSRQLREFGRRQAAEFGPRW